MRRRGWASSLARSEEEHRAPSSLAAALICDAQSPNAQPTAHHQQHMENSAYLDPANRGGPGGSARRGNGPVRSRARAPTTRAHVPRPTSYVRAHGPTAAGAGPGEKNEKYHLPFLLMARSFRKSSNLPPHTYYLMATRFPQIITFLVLVLAGMFLGGSLTL